MGTPPLFLHWKNQFFEIGSYEAFFIPTPLPLAIPTETTRLCDVQFKTNASLLSRPFHPLRLIQIEIIVRIVE